MADVKFPNISQNNNNSFVGGDKLNQSAVYKSNPNNLSEYGDNSGNRNGNDARSQSFHSGRIGTGGNGTSIMNAKK